MSRLHSVTLLGHFDDETATARRTFRKLDDQSAAVLDSHVPDDLRRNRTRPDPSFIAAEASAFHTAISDP